MWASRLVGICGLVACCAASVLKGNTGFDEIQVFNEATKQLRNRGDQSKAKDDNPATWSYLTPSGNQANTWHLVAVKFKTKQRVNYVRVAKFRPDRTYPHYNTFKYSQTEGAATTVSDFSFTSVVNLENGCNGNELNAYWNYDKVSGINGETSPFHDFNSHGWYCLSFDPIEATAFAIGFKQGCCTHFKLGEIQVGYEEALVPTTETSTATSETITATTTKTSTATSETITATTTTETITTSTSMTTTSTTPLVFIDGVQKVQTWISAMALVGIGLLVLS